MQTSNDYLSHYGVVGMRWGQRMLKNRITNAKSIGNKEKAKKLQSRFDENESIRKMKTSEKIFLSREGVLANQRLIAQGQDKVARLMTLHGINSIAGLASNAVGSAAAAPFNQGLQEGKRTTLNMLGSLGASALASFAAMKVRDNVYKKIGN